MITAIIREICIQASPHNPCLYSGIVNSESSTLTDRQEIHVGMYVDDFVFFSTSQREEDLFQPVLESHIKMDFMGKADHFLGTAFTWKRLPNDQVAVHLCHSAFT